MSRPASLSTSPPRTRVVGVGGANRLRMTLRNIVICRRRPIGGRWKSVPHGVGWLHDAALDVAVRRVEAAVAGAEERLEAGVGDQLGAGVPRQARRAAVVVGVRVG